MSLQSKQKDCVSTFRFLLSIVILMGIVGILSAFLLTNIYPECPACEACSACPSCPKAITRECPVCPECGVAECETEVETVIKYQCYDGSLKENEGDCPRVKTEEGVVGNSCMEIISHRDRINEYGFYTLTGEIKNNCGSAKTPTIYINLYDEDDEVLTSSFTFANPPNIENGEVHGFEFGQVEDYIVNNVDRHTIRVAIEDIYNWE